jgi:cytochrome c oxidase subunit 1
MAGVYYWMPKMSGKMMNKKLGLAHFWTMFIFFNLTFFPMFIIGLLGQPRRVFTYAKNLQGLNDFSSISAFLLGLSFLLFLFNLLYSLWINPVKASSNPWDSLGLEWQTASPIPPHNFDRIPVIMSDPYHYSEEGAPPLADFGENQRVTASSTASAGAPASANEQ